MFCSSSFLCVCVCVFVCLMVLLWSFLFSRGGGGGGRPPKNERQTHLRWVSGVMMGGIRKEPVLA